MAVTTHAGCSWRDMDEAARKEYWATLALRHSKGLGARSLVKLLRTFGSAYGAVEAGRAGVQPGWGPRAGTLPRRRVADGSQERMGQRP